jgi:predicted glycoside hydrolase/deacetylase ChbG (UPF0249 family)
VLTAGLQPTHLDWHALRFGSRTDIFDLMIRLAKKYGLALRVIDPGRNRHIHATLVPGE